MTRAVWPKPSDLDRLGRFLGSQIDEGIVWKEIRSAERKGIATRSYGFERDRSKKVNHPKHFLKPTHLQLEFCPDYNIITVEFVCLPDNERGKGIGTRVLNYLEEFALSLGYKVLTLSSMHESERFWLKNGFQPLDDTAHRYPRAMVKLLSANVDPEYLYCQL